MDIPDRLPTARRTGGRVPPCDEGLVAAVPLLFTYLTQDVYKDGEQRLLPEVVIECGYGGWIVTVKDHEEGLQASLEVDQWEDIPSAVSHALEAGKMPWKEFKTYRKKRPQPKKGQ